MKLTHVKASMMPILVQQAVHIKDSTKFRE